MYNYYLKDKENDGKQSDATKQTKSHGCSHVTGRLHELGLRDCLKIHRPRR